MRSSLLAELSSDYVRFAKARGLSANRILVCHILRNALPPVVTIFFQQFGFLIAGGAVIESVFSIKGIGTYLVDSVVAADTIAVSTCIVVIAAIFVVANFMADIINRPMSSLGQLFSQINLKKRKKISPTRLSNGFEPI